MSKYYKADVLIESLESMCDDMHSMNDLDQASGVTSALWLADHLIAQ